MSEIGVDANLRHEALEQELDYVDAFQQLFEASDDTIAISRPKLWLAAERVSACLVNPDQQRAIALYAGVLDWHYFGKPGDPAPEGMVLTVDSDGDRDISLDYREPYLHDYFGSVDSALDRAGLREGLEPHRVEMHDRDPQINSLLDEFLRSSSEYQLLASFDDPTANPEPAPLTPYWRQIREIQIEQGLRERFGYSPGEPIPLDSPMFFELRREMYRLDSETMITPQEPVTAEAALQRARAYLTPFVDYRFNQDHNNNEVKFGSVVYEAGDGLYIKAEGKEEIDSELREYSEDAAWDISDTIYTGQEELKFLVCKFLGVAIDKILDPRANGQYKKILEAAVEEAKHYLRDVLYEVVDRSSIHSRYSGHDSTLLLRKPQGEYFDADQMEALGKTRSNLVFQWADVLRSKSELSSAGELRRDLNFPIGQVEKYGPRNFRTGARLIQTRARSEPVASRSSEEDLVITYSLPSDRDSVPYVPGYELVSISPFWDRYGFRVSPEGDPYQTCQVVINKARRIALAETYESIGLTELAHQVAVSKRLTVNELAYLIRSNSDYYVPDGISIGVNDPLANRNTYFNKLTDFAKIVRRGRLQTQCTGASGFMRESLEAAFGAGCSGIAVGKVIDANDEIINMAGHAQTVFAHNGKQYILDSTPPYNLNEGPREEVRSGKEYTQPRHAPTAPKLALADHTGEVTSTSPPPEKTLEEKVSGLVQSLVEQSKVVFNLPTDQALYEQLVKLPVSDPARKTFELLLQFQRGKLGTEEVKRIAEYVNNCSEAAPEIRIRMGFGHYSINFLEQLRLITWRLEWAIRDSNGLTD